MVTGANRQLHRQSSQKLNDTRGSHADHNLSNSTVTPLDPVNQIALARKKIGEQKLFTITCSPEKYINIQ